MLGRLIELLAAASKEERRVAAARLIALAEDDVGAVAALRSALVDSDPHRRWGAAFVLYRAGVRDDDIFASAVEALGADDGDVRWAAAEIVVELARSDEDRCGRIRGIAAGPDTKARKMALYCLRDLGIGDEALFAGALKAADVAVRLAAIACFGRISVLSRVGIDALRAVVEHDTDAGTRRAATVALGNAGNHEAEVRPALERLRAQSEDPDLARATARALDRLASARRAS